MSIEEHFAHAIALGYNLGLLPHQIDDLTIAEIFEMFRGYQHRLRAMVRPFALQSFITQSMFSDKVMLDDTIRWFESSVGLPKEE